MASMKKVSALALGVALSLNIAGAHAADAAPSTAPASHDKVLRVGCDAAFAPFTYTDDKGQLIGFDVDLIKAIAEEMGYTIDMKGYPFDGIIPTLMTNNIDLIISGFTISPERSERVDFSDPYYRCGLTFLVKNEDAKKFDDFDDLSKAEICTQIGTTGALYLQKTLKNAKLKQFNTPPETYLELQNGGCDVVVNDRPVNDFFLTQHPENKKSVKSVDIKAAQSEYYGIAVAKGNTKLLNLINEGLDRLVENGKFGKISEKWFGYDISDDLRKHAEDFAKQQAAQAKAQVK